MNSYGLFCFWFFNDRVELDILLGNLSDNMRVSHSSVIDNRTNAQL